ncbi:MAG: hypothetical protein HYZ42_09470, partial [Bacteroidetes bacterium]|nr:hypothetical protein [Bacteroidota bacterium]
MRLIILLSLVLVTLCSFYMNEARQPYPYLGQQCPPDMEFIPGNDHIPSFFIGKSQETNMDYLIYLSWLDRVFKDYPDVLNRLQPHEFVDDSLSQFNDPYLKPQLRNPAFAYYPVVGLDWWQIQQYLAWKTDRINESILIENDFFDYNPEIDHREDNFNTEAFLEGKVRQLINKPNALKYYFN